MRHAPKTVVIDWLNTIWKTDLPPNAKYIAAYLRRFMNDEKDMAWPSLARIRGETGLTQPTVLKYLGLLEREGWISRERGGPTTSTKYYARLPKKIEDAIHGVGKEATYQVGKEATQVGKEATQGVGKQLTPNKQYINKQINTCPSDQKITSDVGPDFEEYFWNPYPKKVKKPDALKAWKKINPSLELAERIRDHLATRAWPRDKKYIPYPATFLRNDQWEDEHEPIEQEFAL